MRTGKTLSFESWPAADRAAWDRLFVNGGLFEVTGRGCGWSPRTVKRFRYCHSRWLKFLADQHPDLIEGHTHDRLSRDLIGACLATLAAEGLKPGSLASFLDGLTQLHAAMDVGRTPQWLRRLARSHMAEAYAASDRPDFRVSVDTIWHGTLKALQASEASRDQSIKSAIAYRDGLILALLTFTLLRRENLARLDLKLNLTRTGEGWRVWIDASAMKNRKELERFLPEGLGCCLNVYLDRFRPTLLDGRNSDSLWINYAGGSLQPNSLAMAVKRTTRSLFGIELRPHDLRRIASTSIATDAPEQIYLATQLLGHSSRVVTERHYNRATSLTAGRRHSEVMDELRRVLANEMTEERICRSGNR